MIRQILKRFLNKPSWHNLRNLEPVSKQFALDRGTPIDRFYIDDFLGKNRSLISGTVLEIAESYYCKKFGENVEKYEILHATDDNPLATIIGDLTNFERLPESEIDCFVCTQTYNFIYDFNAAIKGSYHLIKNDGFLLATVAGISQISRYDMDRWGDYWRFTTLSMKKAVGEVFGNENVEVECYGNVLASISFLEGISAEELSNEELFHKDEDYQMVITIKAQKKLSR